MSSFCYRFLNKKSGAIISDLEIDAFNNKCCDKVKTYFSESALSSYSLKRLSLLFTIKKPAVMPDDKWEEIQKYLSANYISKYIGDLYLSDRKKITSVDTQCPEFIQKTWSFEFHRLSHPSDGCGQLPVNLFSEMEHSWDSAST